MNIRAKRITRGVQASKKVGVSSASRTGNPLDKSLREGVVIETHEAGGNTLHHLLHRIVHDNLHEEIVTGVNLGREWS